MPSELHSVAPDQTAHAAQDIVKALDWIFAQLSAAAPREGSDWEVPLTFQEVRVIKMINARGAITMDARNQLLGLAAEDSRLARVRPNGLEDVAQYRADVDWQKAGALGVPITTIHNTISTQFGSAYINDFIQGGRVKRVYSQADAQYRMVRSACRRDCHTRQTTVRSTM